VVVGFLVGGCAGKRSQVEVAGALPGVQVGREVSGELCSPVMGIQRGSSTFGVRP